MDIQIEKVGKMVVIKLRGLLDNDARTMFDTLETGLAWLPRSVSSGDPKDIGFEESTCDSCVALSLPVEKEEEINFSAFYSKEVAVEKWFSLLVYAFVPSGLEAVRQDAERFKAEIGNMLSD